MALTLLGRKEAGGKARWALSPWHADKSNGDAYQLPYFSLTCNTGTYMPFGPKSWMKDSWLMPRNSVWKEAKNPYFRKAERKKINLSIWKRHALDTTMCKHMWGTTQIKTMALPWKNRLEVYTELRHNQESDVLCPMQRQNAQESCQERFYSQNSSVFLLLGKEDCVAQWRHK